MELFELRFGNPLYGDWKGEQAIFVVILWFREAPVPERPSIPEDPTLWGEVDDFEEEAGLKELFERLKLL